MYSKVFLGSPEYSYGSLEMHYKRRCKIFICSVILGELEAFRNYKGLSVSFTSAERVGIRAAQECSEVASALVRGIFELFDVSFKGKK